MKHKGYFGIGCIGIKTPHNFARLCRSALIMGADFTFLIGTRFKQDSSDTAKSWRHLPLFEYKDFGDFNKHRPYNCNLIGVELMELARSVKNFVHPKQACYLLGAEDFGLSEEAIDACQEIIRLPGDISLNISVAGSIVLFDRITKADNFS